MDNNQCIVMSVAGITGRGKSQLLDERLLLACTATRSTMQPTAGGVCRAATDFACAAGTLWHTHVVIPQILTCDTALPASIMDCGGKARAATPLSNARGPG